MDQFIVSTHGTDQSRRYLCVEAEDMPLKAWYVVKELAANDEQAEDAHIMKMAEYFDPYGETSQ